MQSFNTCLYFWAIGKSLQTGEYKRIAHHKSRASSSWERAFSIIETQQVPSQQRSMCSTLSKWLCTLPASLPLFIHSFIQADSHSNFPSPHRDMFAARRSAAEHPGSSNWSSSHWKPGRRPLRWRGGAEPWPFECFQDLGTASQCNRGSPKRGQALTSRTSARLSCRKRTTWLCLSNPPSFSLKLNFKTRWNMTRWKTTTSPHFQTAAPTQT